MTKALIVRPDGSREHANIDANTPGVLQELVGGWVEYVFVTPGVHAYVNEEGKLLGFPVNLDATRLAGLAGVDLICGTAVFLGDGVDGAEGDLPPEWQAVTA